jgi:cytochrome c553
MRTRIARSLWAPLFAGCLALAGAAGAQTVPNAKGIESADYEWNAMHVEKIDALELVGDVKNGELAYQQCSGCHLPSGSGQPDGTFPQLAGQHETVLIKQIADIRAGRRRNAHPQMVKVLGDYTDEKLQAVVDSVSRLQWPARAGKDRGR